MLSRSERFDDAIRNLNNVPASVVFAGQVTIGFGAFGVNVIVQDVPILSGAIQVDASAERRRTLSSCQIPDITGTWSTLDQANPFSPYGPEFRPFVGFDYGDGSDPEILPLGVFRIEDISASDMGEITVSGYDRSLVVAAAQFETPWVILAGTTPEDAIVSIVERAFPGIETDIVYSGFTLPLTVLREGSNPDPWKHCLDLARETAGAECFFGPTGTLVIRPIPDATLNPPVEIYRPGADSILLGALDRLSARDVHNVVVVVGEGPDNTTPIWATAEVTDAQSPIFPNLFGFGRRPAFIKAQVTTTLQAQVVAAAYIREQAGAAERTSFTAVPHPAHEGGDVVRIKVEDMGLDVLAVLEQFTLDMTLRTPTSYQTKGRRVA